ncbi:MAG: hypothetical protein U5P10_00800 [Spirochaetia bacterium]|nr:hypothetical protein [Spirochaetia bacterium]
MDSRRFNAFNLYASARVGAILIGLSVLMMQAVQTPEEYYHRTNGYVQASKTVGPDHYEVSIEYALPDSSTRVARGVVQSETVVVEDDRLIVHYNPYSPDEISLPAPPPIKPEIPYIFRHINRRLRISTLYPFILSACQGTFH